MKARRNTVADRLREAFRLEPLEPRVLLSADPVLGAARVVMAPERQEDQLALEAYDSAIVRQATQASSTVVAEILRQASQSRGMVDFAVDATAFDLARVQDRLGFLEGSFAVQPGQVMGGSGQLVMDVYNDGTIAPGYSPGRVDISGDYAQTGTLLIEIGGTAAGTGYDQLNVSGQATLDGRLELALWNGYRPGEGETFDILTFASAVGAFDVGAGFIQEEAGVWFEIEQLADRLRLTAHEIDPTLGYLLDALPAGPVDSMGQWVNHDYFADVSPITFSGAVSLGSNLYVDGTFTIGYDADEAVVDPHTGSAINADFWKLSIVDGTGKLGLDIDDPSALGFQLSDIDLGLLYVDPTDAAIDYAWLLAEGSIGDASAVLGPLSLSASGTPLAFELAWAYGETAPGVAAEQVLDLSALAVDVGGGHVFDDAGARGEFLLLSGAFEGSLGAIELSAEVGLSIDSDRFVLAGSSLQASMSGGGFSVGIADGELGLVSSISPFHKAQHIMAPHTGVVVINTGIALAGGK